MQTPELTEISILGKAPKFAVLTNTPDSSTTGSPEKCL